MPNIKPISDLRNYNKVLRDIAIGEPVFLTKNGRGKFAVVDINEYEKLKATFLRNFVIHRRLLIWFPGSRKRYVDCRSTLELVRRYFPSSILVQTIVSLFVPIT